MFAHKEISMRPVESQDLEKIRNLRNEQSTWQYLSDASLISESMQHQWFENLKLTLDERYYTVEQKTFGQFIGVIRTDQIDLRNRSIRVGCDIIPKERGKGFGTMTFEMLLKFLFIYHSYHRLWLCVLENNEVAKKLYKNVGFKEEGRLRAAIWREGKWMDYIVMSILEEEYRNE